MKTRALVLFSAVSLGFIARSTGTKPSVSSTAVPGVSAQVAETVVGGVGEAVAPSDLGARAVEVPPQAGALSPPDPTQGSVDSSGRFVPANKKPEVPPVPVTPAALQKQATDLIEKTGETTFRIGQVNCDRATKTISFQAKVQMREGQLEYALVTTKGKVHESLLATEALPLHIHMAALLLGMAPQGEALKPVPISIEVAWETNGPTMKRALEELVALARENPQGKTGATLARGSWNYQGSVLDAGGFAAEREGSIIAIISDSFALAANPRQGNADDTMHVVNTALLPSAEMPVTVSLRPVIPAR
jgi:hypothetical protein